MTGFLDMDNEPIRNVGPGRHGTADALTHVQFENFFYDLDTNSGYIQAQNPVDMKNQKIVSLAEGTDNADAITKHQLETSLVPKAEKTELVNYLRRDAGNNMLDILRMNNFRIVYVGNPQHDLDAVNKQYLEQHNANLDMSDFLKRDGTVSMTGYLDMDGEPIRNIGNGRPGTQDALTHAQLEFNYMDLNTDSGSIEMQNPIDMKDKRMTNLKDPRPDQKDALSYKFFTDNYLKINNRNDVNMLGRRFYNVGNPQHDNQLMPRNYADGRFARIDTATIDMKNKRVVNVADPTNAKDAVNKRYLESHTSNLDFSDYVKRNGSVSFTGNIDFGDNKIIRVGNGTNSTDLVNRGYIDTALAAKPNVNQVLLRDGTQEMLADLNMSNHEIKNLGQGTSGSHAVNLSQLNSKTAEYLPLKGAIMQGDIEMNSFTILGIRDENRDNAVVSRKFVKDELNKKPNAYQVVLRNGSQEMTGNLNMNNQRITNVKDATHNRDAITLKQVNDAVATLSTKNNEYTDQKIAESHISTHGNRENVLAYAMEDADEFTTDFGLQDAQKVSYSDSPHLNNKSAIAFKVRKTTDGSSLFKGRFDFNLYTLTEKNFSNQYTNCLEIIFPKDRRYDEEFNSTKLTFEKLNMNIDKFHTIKINNDYKYYRTILNISPDGTSKLIQRRLYTTIECSYDNLSPNLLQLYAIIYGIKGEAKNDLDFTIYDYEKAYEVVNNQFQMHVPINMNGNDI